MAEAEPAGGDKDAGQSAVKDIPGGKLKQVVLSSGVKAIIQYVPDSPAALAGLTVKAGSEFDGEQWGRAHLLEHMLFRRTAKYAGGRLGVSLENAGARRGAMTDRENIKFWEVVPGEALNLALDIEADRLSGLVFVNKELENERSLMAGELKELQSRPLRRINIFFLRGFFSELQGGDLVPDGSEANLAKITGSDLLDCYKEHFIPENACVSLISSLPIAAAESKLEERFGQNLLKARENWQKNFKLPQPAKAKAAASAVPAAALKTGGPEPEIDGTESLNALLQKEGCGVYALAWPVKNESASALAVRLVLDSFLTNGRLSYVSEILHKHDLEAKVRVIRDDDPFDRLYTIVLQPSEGIEPGELASVMEEIFRDRDLEDLNEQTLRCAREKAAAEFYKRWQDYPERLDLLNLARRDNFSAGWENLPELLKKVRPEEVRSLWRSMTAQPPRSYISEAGTSFKAIKSGISARSVFVGGDRPAEYSEDAETAKAEGANAASETAEADRSEGSPGENAPVQERVFVPDPEDIETEKVPVPGSAQKEAGSAPAAEGKESVSVPAAADPEEGAPVQASEGVGREDVPVTKFMDESEAITASVDVLKKEGAAADAHIAAEKNKIHYFTLPNGVKAALWEDKALPVIALHGFLAGGNLLDPEDGPALSKTASRLLGTSTAWHSARENAGIAEKNAFYLSFLPQDDGVIIKGWCLRERFPEFLALLNEYLSACRPRQSDIEAMYIRRDSALRNFMLADLNRAYASLTALIFPQHAWARRLEKSGGEQNWTEDELTGQLDRILRPEYLTLSFAGCIEAAEAQRMCSQGLAKLSGGKAEAADVNAFTLRNSPRMKKSKTFIQGSGAQSLILAGQYGPAPGDKDYAACRVLLQILGGGDSSRLAVRAVHAEKLGGAAYTVCVPSVGGSMWSGVMQVRPGKEDRALAVFKQELNRLADPGPAAEELKRAVSACKGSQQVRWLSPVARAEWVWLQLVNNVQVSDPDALLRAYDRVTLHDIRAAAKKWFLFDDIQIVTVKAASEKKQ
ncbi:insulinase family protein [bacterium]|nr:insulinase family protein [bacterium]